MPAPSRYNRKLKARNDARKARAGGGRTASEAAFGRSQKAAGRAVSRTNTRVPKANRVRAVRSPLALPEVQSSVERLRTKYGASGRTLSQESLGQNLEVSQKRNRAERKLENAALRAAPTRGEALKIAPAFRKATRLNAEGTSVERLGGRRQIGNEPLRAVMGVAQRGKLIQVGDKYFTTPRVSRANQKVKKAKRQLRKAKARAVPKITSDSLNSDQEKFAAILAKRTGLDPGVVGAWLVAEQGGPPGDEYSAKGYYNFLNIGPFLENPRFRKSPKDAANFTADSLLGKSRGLKMGAGIPGIVPNARGRSPKEQAQVILGSGWGTEQMPLGSVSVRPGNSKGVRRAEAKMNRLEEVAADLGLSPSRERQSGPVRWGPKKAKQLAGAWAGTEAILEKAGRGFSISSRKRDASHSLSQSNPGSDHNTANTNAYAHDIPAVGDENGIPIAEAYHKRLGLNEPIAIGTYNRYTSRKYPGYQFQILWNVSGHYDHVHVGAKWTGEDLPAGTYLGGQGATYSASGGGGTNIAAGGGGSAPAAGGRGGQRNTLTPREKLERLGYEITGQGIKRTGLAAGISGTDSGEETVSTSQMKRRYGVK